MVDKYEIRFGPFRLDSATAQLWQGEQTVALQPKPLAVLLYLAQRPGQIVTKQELLKEVWTGTVVTKAVVKECLRAIRAALGEDAVTPQHVETVGREGYRFIETVQSPGSAVRGQNSQSTPNPQHPAPIIVGRDPPLEQLQTGLLRALRGERQLVFVTGEPGIGKTALVDLFQERTCAHQHVWVGRGQCVEHYGEGEAYLPVLEALEHLTEGPGGVRLREVLQQYAPTWLAQLPALVSDTERKELQEIVRGATRERMLREITEALERLSSVHPVVLLLEDLHWSDHSTIELLSHLAQRRQLARLLVLGTYRPTDLVLGKHTLKGVKQELQAHGRCEEERLELLSAHDVTDYLARRFPQHQFPSELAAGIHQRTEGNALFVVNVVEELVDQAKVVQDAGVWKLKETLAILNVPGNVRQLIERQLERLSEEEQRVLEAASVAGTEFTVAAIAAALKQEIDSVEDICEGLAWQGLFLIERGIAEWPDGVVSGRYSFRHALYQNVLYERIAEARRVRLHRLIGERLEIGHGTQVQEIAAELAVHFERGHEYHRAVRYCEQAGRNAIQRSAHVEAVSLLTKGLGLLKTLPDTPERAQQELTLQNILGVSLRAIKGYADPEVERTYKRALELCQRMGETPQLFPVLQGLFAFYIVRAEHQAAHELAEQLLGMAQRQQDPALLLEAHRALGQAMFHRGEFVRAREHFEQGIALYDPQQHRSHAFAYAGNPKVVCLDNASISLWYLGYSDQAVKRSHEAITLAQQVAHPFSLAHALWFAALLHHYRRDAQAVQEQAEALITLCKEQGFAFWLVGGTIFQGWALAEQGQGEKGIAQIRQGIVAWQATGAGRFRPYFLALLAEVCGQTDRAEEGLALLAEAVAVAQKDGDHLYEPELYRLKGTLTLQSKASPGQVQGKSRTSQKKSVATDPQSLTPNPQLEAEACFLTAIEVARRQQAKSLELRATISLARLWQRQGKKKEAHHMLAEIYSWFTEGFDTKDLQEAKALLDSIGEHN